MSIGARPTIVAETPGPGREYADEHPELTDSGRRDLARRSHGRVESSLHCNAGWHQNRRRLSCTAG